MPSTIFFITYMKMHFKSCKLILFLFTLLHPSIFRIMKNMKGKFPKWTMQEDSKLYACVIKYRPRQWDSISQMLGTGKTGNSCRQRWFNYLRPDLVLTDFTYQEKIKILLLHRVLGNRWSEISRRMPGRSDNAIKNYWNSQLTREARELDLDVSSHEFQKVMNERCANTTATLPPSAGAESYCPSDFVGGVAESSYTTTSVFGGGGAYAESSYTTTTFPPSVGDGGAYAESSYNTTTFPPSDIGSDGGAYAESSYTTTTNPPSVFGGGGAYAESSYTTTTTFPPLVGDGGAYAESSYTTTTFPPSDIGSDGGAYAESSYTTTTNPPSVFGGGGAYAESSYTTTTFPPSVGDGGEYAESSYTTSTFPPSDIGSDGAYSESSYTTTTFPPSVFGGAYAESTYTTTMFPPSVIGSHGGAYAEPSYITTTFPPSVIGGHGGAYAEPSYTTTTMLSPWAFGGGSAAYPKSTTTLPHSDFGDGGAFTELSPLSFEISLELGNDGWGASFDAEYPNFSF